MIDKATKASQEEELDRLASEVQSLRQQLRHAQRLAAVGTMTAMVAHEFNNILTPIVNYAQMARTNPKLAEKAIDKAANGGERATQICKALMGMTQTGQDVTQVRVSKVIEQTLAAMVRDPAKDGIELSVNVPPHLTVKARSVELQQVLLNLLINARAAVLANTTGAKRITISACKKAGTDIRVTDNGSGISPENLEKIFQPFFTTKRPADGESGGHGLGLSICRDIITQMNGTISVQSTLGQGSTFTVRLPK
jgi:signal transduction histidine kinase